MLGSGCGLGDGLGDGLGAGLGDGADWGLGAAELCAEAALPNTKVSASDNMVARTKRLLSLIEDSSIGPGNKNCL
jgi:hypothetical protein